jgi:hypothetical protein
VATLILALGLGEAYGQGSGHSAAGADGDGAFGNLLLSGRMEIIHLLNITDTIREFSKEKSRFYFNNIFLNFEGGLGKKTDFIIEYQPLVSELYLLGGFVTIAEALEGIGLESADARKIQIDRLISAKIRELESASEKASFERAQINFFINDRFGIRLGRVRNPFGFWDDYSLFRNLSSLKTDPVSLGVALRRADLGFVVFGNAPGASYEFGVLQGNNTFANKEVDNFKDLALKLERNLGPLDLAANLYLHDVGRTAEPSNALGLSYRYRATYNLTLLGEFISIENESIDIKTRGFYIQGHYDLSDYLKDGLRWNMFFETYDSNMLDIDLEPNLDYRFAGTYFQASTGFVYACNRNIDLGVKALGGADEEGDPFFRMGIKIDAKF